MVGFYQRADGRSKKKLLGLIFSDKIEFDENKVPKFSFTPPINSLIQISKNAEKDKVSIDQIEGFVRGSGDFKFLRI